MTRTTSPLDLLGTGMQMAMLAAETNAVMAMRLWGMAGFWNVTGGENKRMVSEKPAAITQSAVNATFAALRGDRPDQIVVQAIKPLRAKTRSNSRRLAKRGPKLGKGKKRR